MTGLPRLKLALLGCGDVAQRDYLPEIHRLSDRVELVAVCSRTEQRARDVAAQYGARAWYTDYARMLAESDADLVANLTPIQLHAETTLAAACCPVPSTRRMSMPNGPCVSVCRSRIATLPSGLET